MDHIQELRGLPFLFAKEIYQDELTLHFGTERPHTSPKLAGKVRGTYVLWIHSPTWFLRSGDVVFQVASKFKVAPGSIVEKALTFRSNLGTGLALDFSDKSYFYVFPDGDDLMEDWELLTPTQIVRFGPGQGLSVEYISGREEI